MLYASVITGFKTNLRKQYYVILLINRTINTMFFTRAYSSHKIIRKTRKNAFFFIFEWSTHACFGYTKNVNKNVSYLPIDKTTKKRDYWPFFMFFFDSCIDISVLFYFCIFLLNNVTSCNACDRKQILIKAK